MGPCVFNLPVSLYMIIVIIVILYLIIIINPKYGPFPLFRVRS